MKKNEIKCTNKKKLLTAIAAGMTALGILIVGSIAYFTDRVSENTAADVGNLQISLTDLSVKTDDVVAPGCIVPMMYTINNIGTLALDEREKIALSVFEEDGTTPVELSTSPSEFEIYESSDVEMVTGKGYAPRSGAVPIGTRTTEGFTGSGSNRIIYQIEQSTLNGSDKELSTVEKSLSRDYVVLFKGESSNTYQNVTVKIDILVEAKQHAYTSAYDNDWTQLQSKSVSFNAGDQNVVPSKTE